MVEISERDKENQGGDSKAGGSSVRSRKLGLRTEKMTTIARRTRPSPALGLVSKATPYGIEGRPSREVL